MNSRRTRGGGKTRRGRDDVLLSVSQYSNIPFILRPVSTLPSGRLVEIRFSLRKHRNANFYLNPVVPLPGSCFCSSSSSSLSPLPALHAAFTPFDQLFVTRFNLPPSPLLPHDAFLLALPPPSRCDSHAHSCLALSRRSSSLPSKRSSRETTPSQSRSPPQTFFPFIRFRPFHSSYSISSIRISHGRITRGT